LQKNCNYNLQEHEPDILLDAGKILDGLDTLRVGRSILCFKEVNSTNDVAWDSARQGNSDGLVILAEAQRHGRGRHGKIWLSPPGTAILMSVVLMDDSVCINPGALTIAAGLAVAEGIDQASGLHTRLKWPNDVMFEGKKLAGILVERRSYKKTFVMVIGMGINVFASPSNSSVDSPAASLAELVDSQKLSRNDIVQKILRRLDYWIIQVAASNLAMLHDMWIPRCDMIGNRVRLKAGGILHAGRVLDVEPLGGLLLVNDLGARELIPAEGTTVVK